MTEDLPGIIIALMLIFFAIRYFYPASSTAAVQASADGTPSSGPLRGITSNQIQNLHQTFPHISVTSIAYSLSKTHSVQRTGEEILEKGFLPEPASTFPTHPYIVSIQTAQRQAEASGSTATSTKAARAAKYPSLIEKYNLQDRIADQSVENITAAISRTDKGKGREGGGLAGGASHPDSKAEKLSLLQRKEQLILDSRRKLMENLMRDKARSAADENDL